MVAALEYLRHKYGIVHIQISAYNLQANGVVEVAHRPIRDALKRLCKGDEKLWPKKTHLAFWADHITTSCHTGYSPFYSAQGIEPILPFDILYATFLFPKFDGKLSNADLIYMRARQLEQRDKDIAHIQQRVTKARLASNIVDFQRRFQNTIHDYDFRPGTLVLVLNKKIEVGANRKFWPRYFGPMVVVRRTTGGAYYLAELNGVVLRLKFAAFRLVPYFARSKNKFKVTEFVNPSDLSGIADDGDEDNFA